MKLAKQKNTKAGINQNSDANLLSKLRIIEQKIEKNNRKIRRLEKIFREDQQKAEFLKQEHNIAFSIFEHAPERADAYTKVIACADYTKNLLSAEEKSLEQEYEFIRQHYVNNWKLIDLLEANIANYREARSIIEQNINQDNQVSVSQKSSAEFIDYSKKIIELDKKSLLDQKLLAELEKDLQDFAQERKRQLENIKQLIQQEKNSVTSKIKIKNEERVRNHLNCYWVQYEYIFQEKSKKNNLSRQKIAEKEHDELFTLIKQAELELLVKNGEIKIISYN